MLLQSSLFRTKPVAMALVALGGLVLSTAPSLAEIKTTTVAQSTFVIRCMAMGGTVEAGGTAQISVCKLPSGQTISCDFASDPAYCDVFKPSLPFGDLLGPNADTVKQGGGRAGPKVDPAPGTVK